MADNNVWGGLPSYITGMFKSKKKPAEKPDSQKSSERDTPEARAKLDAQFDALISEQNPAASEPAPIRKATLGGTLARGGKTFLGIEPEGGFQDRPSEYVGNNLRALFGYDSAQEDVSRRKDFEGQQSAREAQRAGDVDELGRYDVGAAADLGALQTSRYKDQRQRAFDEAVAGGDVDAARRFDPDFADKRDNVRREGALRAVRAARQIGAQNPDMGEASLRRFADEQPNLFSQDELLVYEQGGVQALEAMLADPVKRSGSAPRMQAGTWLNPETGVEENVFLDPVTQRPVLDENGNPLRPQPQVTYKEVGPGIIRAYDTRSTTAAGGRPGPSGGRVGASGAFPEYDPNTPGGSGYVPQQSVRGTQSSNPQGGGVGDLTEQVARAEALVAGTKKTAEEKAKMLAELDLKIPDLRNKSAAVAARARDVTQLSDEDLELVTGLPKPLKGSGGFSKIHIPGSRAAIIESSVSGLEDAVRMIGFQGVKGAGPVTEAESLFAANAIASLDKARQAGPAEYRRETARIQTELNSMMDTAIQQTAMLVYGPQRDTVTRSGAETQDMLLKENERNNMNPDAPVTAPKYDPDKEARYQAWLRSRGQ